MRVRGECIVCILALLVLAVSAAFGQDGLNSTQPARILRVGFERSLTESCVGLCSAKNCSGCDQNVLQNTTARAVHSLSTLSRSEGKEAFNVSWRVAPKLMHSRNISLYRPLYAQGEYSSVRPFYEVPGFLKTRPVYDITGYPLIKTPNSIP